MVPFLRSLCLVSVSGPSLPCHFFFFFRSSPTPHRTQSLQLHCELNCNEAHAAKYENETDVPESSKSLEGEKALWLRVEMAINSYVCCSDTLQTVLMTASQEAATELFLGDLEVRTKAATHPPGLVPGSNCLRECLTHGKKKSVIIKSGFQLNYIICILILMYIVSTTY